jgi:hypothetical protein
VRFYLYKGIKEVKVVCPSGFLLGRGELARSCERGLGEAGIAVSGFKCWFH